MPPAGRVDPFPAFRFTVEVDGIVSSGFSEVTGLESETDVVEYRTGGEAVTRKLPGLTKFGNITLKRGLTTNPDLWNWRQAIVDGKADRRNGSIIMLDREGNEVLRWGFRNGWPCKWEGPALNAKTSEIAIELLEIAHEGLELDT